MNTIKWELEDLAFRTLFPKRFDEISRLIAEHAAAARLAAAHRDPEGRHRPQGGEDQGRGHRPAEAPLLRLPEDDRPRPRLRRHLRPGRRAHPGRHGPRLLRGARRHPRELAAGPGPVQGLHRDAEVQHVPVAAHHGDRPQRQAGRAADPHATRCTAPPSTASPRTGATRRPRTPRSRPARPHRRDDLAAAAAGLAAGGRATRASSSTRCASTCPARRSTSSRPRAT